MMKKLAAIITIFLMLTANQTFAHTSLESSVPSDGEIVEEPLQQIILKYATKVENGSTFQVKNSQGEIMEIGVLVQQDVLKGTADKPLPNDQYTLDWSIIGADGHPIKGTLAFQIDVPEEAAEQAAEETEETEEMDETKAPETESGETKEAELPAESSSSFPVVLMVILGAIALGGLFFLRKRKG
jgi:methionine-rich copper-binding protein CopC